MKKNVILEHITLGKLVHGGQALAVAPDGKKLFIWGGLPGEVVNVLVTKSKKGYAEGYVTEVIEASKDRIGYLQPDDINLSIQPWSIMSYESELAAKQEILNETFAREGLEVQFPSVESVTSGRVAQDRAHTEPGAMRNPDGVSHNGYRNKVEFSFWGDDEGLHLAHYLRSTHHKVVLLYPYHPLIPEQMALAADNILKELNTLHVRAGDLKSLVLRVEAGPQKESRVVSALFVKDRKFPQLDSTDIAVVYSDPKSPASVKTEILYTNGDIKLSDKLLGKNIIYDVFSFFQVNLPVFERALQKIKDLVGEKPSLDMYSGVGAIGLSVGSEMLVEADESSVRMAQINAEGSAAEIIHASSEQALDHITAERVLIVDPPRAGLHPSVVAKIADARPPQVVYLSCNPITQARDIKRLEGAYRVTSARGYNFFPRTPHIESLLVLERV